MACCAARRHADRELTRRRHLRPLLSRCRVFFHDEALALLDGLYGPLSEAVPGGTDGLTVAGPTLLGAGATPEGADARAVATTVVSVLSRVGGQRLALRAGALAQAVRASARGASARQRGAFLSSQLCYAARSGRHQWRDRGAGCWARGRTLPTDHLGRVVFIAVLAAIRAWCGVRNLARAGDRRSSQLLPNTWQHALGAFLHSRDLFPARGSAAVGWPGRKALPVREKPLFAIRALPTKPLARRRVSTPEGVWHR